MSKNKIANKDKKILKLFSVLAITLGIIVSFQNCGEGFTPIELKGQGSLGGSPGNPDSNNPITKSQTLTYSQFKKCAGVVGVGTVTKCLEKNNQLPDGLTQSLINNCQAVNGGDNASLWDIALCMHANNFPPHGYRAPSQLDINKCVLLKGTNGIAGCLGKNGILPAGVTQADIDDCISKVGDSSLEKCFRKKGFIPKRVLSQLDIYQCSKAFGLNSLSECLQNRQQGPESLTQEQLTFCSEKAQAGMAPTIMACLVKNSWAWPNYLSHAEVEQCRSDVGLGSLAGCLQKNGWLPEGVDQAELEDCNVKGNGKIALCLRKKRFLPHIANHADILRCQKVAGTENLAACLETNGLLPMNLTQDEINSCAAAVDGGAAPSIAACFRKKGYLPKTVMQAELNMCAKNVGTDRLAGCLQVNGLIAPGVITQENLNACIAAKGGLLGVPVCMRIKKYVPDQLMQPHINSCLAYAGLPKLAACLSVNGLLPDGVDQSTLDSCVAAKGESGIAFCLVVKGIIGPKANAEHLKGCEKYAGRSKIVQCLNAHNLAHPDLNQATLDNCIRVKTKPNTSEVDYDGVIACMALNKVH